MTNFQKILQRQSGNKSVLILAIILTVGFSDGFSQNQLSKPTRQSALDAFSKEDFEKAYIQFNELSSIYPGDPLYKYYCGVSLVKLERDPQTAISLLKEAQQESGSIRTIPSDGLFYLGRAQQMNGDFSGAIKSYNLYTEQAGKRIAKDRSTPQFIGQCFEKKGELILKKPDNKEAIKKESVQPVDFGKIMSSAKIINNNSDSTLRKETSVSPDYEKLIDQSLNYQFSADSIKGVADQYRMQLDKAPATEKPALKTKISEAEQLSGVNQKLADEKVLAAEAITGTRSGHEILQDKKNIPDSTLANKDNILPVTQNRSNVKGDSILQKIKMASKDSVIQKADNQIVKDTVNQLVTKDQGVKALPKKPEVYSIFEIVAKPAFASDEKVTINPVVPEGLIYRIQLAVFRKPVDLIYFKGITPVYGFKNGVSDVTNYYAGMFRKSEDASKALIKVKAAGFKDAFVVAMVDAKIISAERAAILEKNWGKKSFENVLIRNVSETPKDTVPQTLLFRVEVTRSQKPLNDEQLDILKRFAGNRGLEIIKNESGENIYLIGKFLTFESAEEYADLLTRNGQKDARVAAYLGRREIPVETARQLFDKF